MLHSPLGERNVGKSLTLDLLAKGQGVPTRKHPTMFAGGDQSHSGASVYVLIFFLLLSGLHTYKADKSPVAKIG